MPLWGLRQRSRMVFCLFRQWGGRGGRLSGGPTCTAGWAPHAADPTSSPPPASFAPASARAPVCVLRPHRVLVWLWRWIAPASWDGWRSSRLPYFLKSVCEVGVISLSNVCWNSPARPWEPRSLVQARLLNRRGIFRLSTFLVLALVVFVFRGRGLSLSSKSWSRWREAAVLLRRW